MGSSCLTRGRSGATCIGSMESEPLNYQGIPNSLGSFYFFFHRFTNETFEYYASSLIFLSFIFFFLHRFYSFLLKKFSEQSEFQKHIYLIITELTVWHILPFGSQWTQLLGDKLYLDTIYYEYLYNFMVWSCLVFSNKKYWKSASPVFT